MVLSKQQLSILNSIQPSMSVKKVTRIVNQVASMNNPTDQTKVVRLSQIKRFLKEHEPKFVKAVHFPSKLIEKTMAESEERLANRPNFLISRQMLDTIVRNGEKAIEKTRRDWPALFAYLQLISGRRISELLHSEFFQNNSKKNHVSSRNLSKKKTSEICTFPLLWDMPVKTWLNNIKKIRTVITKQKLNTVNVRVNRYLKKIDPELSSHKMRGIYANIIYEEQQDGENGEEAQNKIGLIKEVLCLENLKTAVHYGTYEFTD